MTVIDGLTTHQLIASLGDLHVIVALHSSLRHVKTQHRVGHHGPGPPYEKYPRRWPRPSAFGPALLTAGPFRAGVIGCGRIGCAFDDDPRRLTIASHAGAYQACEGFSLTGIADPDPRRLERYGDKFGVQGRYLNYKEMLRSESLDVVSVCTPTDSHLEIVTEAVGAGVRAVFCEKPITDTLSAAREMIAVCRQSNVLLFIDHQRRFDAAHRSLAAFIQDGGLGNIQQVTCYYTAGVRNTGTHLFDLIRLLLDEEAAWAQARKSANASRAEGDDNIDAWLCFDRGTLISIQACDVEAYTIFEANLLGTRGRLGIRGHGDEISFETAVESLRFSGYRELRPSASPVANNERREYMMQAVSHIRECLIGAAESVSTGEDGYKALEIVTGLVQAAGSGQRVEFPIM